MYFNNATNNILQKQKILFLFVCLLLLQFKRTEKIEMKFGTGMDYGQEELIGHFL